VEQYRFIISDGDSFEYVGEWPYTSPLAAEAHATQIAKDLSEDDTWAWRLDFRDRFARQ
jgi:hypothetical protein